MGTSLRLAHFPSLVEWVRPFHYESTLGSPPRAISSMQSTWPSPPLLASIDIIQFVAPH